VQIAKGKGQNDEKGSFILIDLISNKNESITCKNQLILSPSL